MSPLICICCGEPIGPAGEEGRENPNMCVGCLLNAGEELSFDPAAPLFQDSEPIFEPEAVVPIEEPAESVSIPD